jgi:hypothetical protein
MMIISIKIMNLLYIILGLIIIVVVIIIVAIVIIVAVFIVIIIIVIVVFFIIITLVTIVALPHFSFLRNLRLNLFVCCLFFINIFFSILRNLLRILIEIASVCFFVFISTADSFSMIFFYNKEYSCVE